MGECEARVEAAKAPAWMTPIPDFARLAEDLDTAWSSPKVTMRTRQQLVRALVNDITVDIDEASREIVLTNPLERWSPLRATTAQAAIG